MISRLVTSASGFVPSGVEDCGQPRAAADHGHYKCPLDAKWSYVPSQKHYLRIRTPRILLATKLCTEWTKLSYTLLHRNVYSLNTIWCASLINIPCCVFGLLNINVSHAFRLIDPGEFNLQWFHSYLIVYWVSQWSHGTAFSMCAVSSCHTAMRMAFSSDSMLMAQFELDPKLCNNVNICELVVRFYPARCCSAGVFANVSICEFLQEKASGSSTCISKDCRTRCDGVFSIIFVLFVHQKLVRA